MLNAVLETVNVKPDVLPDISDWHLVEEHHLILVIVTLILAILVISAGKGLGTIINAWIRKVFGGQAVTVNLSEGHPATSPDPGAQRICQFSPEQCADHKAEFERSKRNVEDILALKKEFSEFKTAFFGKLATIETGVNDIKVTLAGTTAALNLRLEHGDKF